MVYSIRFHEDVGRDIDEAYAFYETRSQGLGENFLQALRKKTNAIREFPESFGLSDRKTYREAMLEGFPFLIVFRIYKGTSEIFVASIHHERKHPAKKFR